MSSTPPLQCLFCKHLNPADAIFCNACGTQLNLQPCKRCGAIDDRAAKKCYKCGASLTLPVQPEAESLLAPAILGKELASSTLSDAGPASTLPTLPTQPTHDLAGAPPESQWAAQTRFSETGAKATRSRRRWLVAIAVLLLALAIDTVSVYSYYGEPEQLAQTEIEKTEVVKQAVPEVPVEPKPDGLTPQDPVMPVDAALKPEDTASKVATRPEVSEKVPPVFNECPQAVATLGLCNAPTNE